MFVCARAQKRRFKVLKRLLRVEISLLDVTECIIFPTKYCCATFLTFADNSSNKTCFIYFNGKFNSYGKNFTTARAEIFVSINYHFHSPFLCYCRTNNSNTENKYHISKKSSPNSWLAVAIDIYFNNTKSTKNYANTK